MPTNNKEYIIHQLARIDHLKIDLLRIRERENPRIILSFRNLIKEIIRIEVVERKIKMVKMRPQNKNQKLIQKIVVKIENNYNRLLKKNPNDVLVLGNFLKKKMKKDQQSLSHIVNIFLNLLLQLLNLK